MPNPRRYSIVIPAFNRAWCLDRAVKSCLCQTFKGEIEIIISNDGSTDNTLEMAKQYAATERCVRYVSHPRNRGKFEAMREGAEAATGEFIIYLDSDDKLLPEAVEEFDNLISEDTSTLIVFARYRRDDGAILGNLPLRSEVEAEKRDYNFLMRHFAVGDYLQCVNRKALFTAGFFVANDYCRWYMHNLWTPLFRYANVVTLSPKVLGHVYTQHADRITKRKNTNAEGWAKGIRYFIYHYGNDVKRAGGRIERAYLSLAFCEWHSRHYMLAINAGASAMYNAVSRICRGGVLQKH